MRLRKDSLGHTHFGYDAWGRIVSMARRRWDAGGRTQPAGAEPLDSCYTYRPDGRLAEETYPHGRKVYYAYPAPQDGHPEKARAVYEELRRVMPAEFDTGGSIGKRYRRQDEIGTPYCITVDFDTLQDNAVTVRDRDSMKQERISLDILREYFFERLSL